MSSARRKIQELSNFDALIIPVHDPKLEHWKLFYVDFKKKQITLVDSYKVNKLNAEQQCEDLKQNLLRHWLIDGWIQKNSSEAAQSQPVVGRRG